MKSEQGRGGGDQVCLTLLCKFFCSNIACFKPRLLSALRNACDCCQFEHKHKTYENNNKQGTCNSISGSTKVNKQVMKNKDQRNQGSGWVVQLGALLDPASLRVHSQRSGLEQSFCDFAVLGDPSLENPSLVWQ